MDYSKNRQSSLSSLSSILPLPKYFDSEWSYAQYYIPTQSTHVYFSSESLSDALEGEKCIVGWIKGPPDDDSNADKGTPKLDDQMVALTYSGGWHRLALLPNIDQLGGASLHAGSEACARCRPY